jgi:hypothetical protein
VAVWAVSVYANRNVNRNSCTEVCRAFSSALRNNNEERAKSLSSAAQHYRVDAWITEHAVVDCYQRGWIEGSLWGTAACEPEAAGQRQCHYTFHCSPHDKSYLFTVEGVTLQRTDDGYRVVDWGDVRESLD